MSWIKQFLLIFVWTVGLWLSVDYFYGEDIGESIGIVNLERKYRVKDDFFHHGLKPNYTGQAYWGSGKNQICTNQYGFKDTCVGPKLSSKEIDLAFIGDSFTEAVGIDYEKSFVGLIHNDLAGKKIANLAVASYSPSIYLAKMEKLIRDGFKFRDVVVFIDISDIQDEAGYVTNEDGSVSDRDSGKDYSKFSMWIRELGRENFKLTNAAYRILKEWRKRQKKDVLPQIYERSYTRSSWTYAPDEVSYEYGKEVKGPNDAIQQAIDAMRRLASLLKKQGTRMMVAVYPWPGQLLHDTRDSMQVKIWASFAEEEGLVFYNFFDVFFDHKEKYGVEQTIDSFFIDGDVHFNELGNQVIANQFMNAYLLVSGSEKE